MTLMGVAEKAGRGTPAVRSLSGQVVEVVFVVVVEEEVVFVEGVVEVFFEVVPEQALQHRTSITLKQATSASELTFLTMHFMGFPSHSGADTKVGFRKGHDASKAVRQGQT